MRYSGSTDGCYHENVRLTEGGSDMLMNMKVLALLFEGEVPVAIDAVGVEGEAGGRGGGP